VRLVGDISHQSPAGNHQDNRSRTPPMIKQGLLLLCCLTGTLVWGREPTEGDVNLDQHLKFLSSSRYPIDQNENSREKIQDHIKDSFMRSGLKRVEHRFNTTVRDEDGQDVVVEGINIIGINEHSSDKMGAVLLVAADYDSARPMCSGSCLELFQNNGVGVAAMLEIARLFDHNSRFSGDWRSDLTTIFVAFDINTKEHLPGSPGEQGSKIFLREWLWPYLNENKELFGGAFILDSISKLNYENSSQKLHSNFQKAFPSAYERISARGKKGDFLAMLNNGDETTATLMDQFKMQYELKLRKKLPFTLEELELEGRPGAVLEYLNHQAHYNFWTFKDNENKAVPLPALLLTDTENERSLPDTEACNGKLCNELKEYMDDDRREFVEATINGVVSTLLQRQSHRIEHNGGMKAVPSIMVSLLLVLIAKLLR
ncbi:unnamed protein product, partial [Meganyctiphanes norvegica]